MNWILPCLCVLISKKFELTCAFILVRNLSFEGLVLCHNIVTKLLSYICHAFKLQQQSIYTKCDCWFVSCLFTERYIPKNLTAKVQNICCMKLNLVKVWKEFTWPTAPFEEDFRFFWIKENNLRCKGIIFNLICYTGLNSRLQLVRLVNNQIFE